MKKIHIFYIFLASFYGLIVINVHANPTNKTDLQATTEYKINQEALDQQKTTETELNALYHAIKDKLKDNKDFDQTFTDAQRAWLKFLDSECQFQSDGLGTVRGEVYAQCRDNFIKRRISDFHYYLTCEEGDLSCPTKR